MGKKGLLLRIQAIGRKQRNGEEEASSCEKYGHMDDDSLESRENTPVKKLGNVFRNVRNNLRRKNKKNQGIAKGSQYLDNPALNSSLIF